MMKTYRSSLLAKCAGVLGVAVLTLAPALAQKPTATVHGHVTNPAGGDFSPGDVKFTSDQSSAYKDAKFSVIAPIDAQGNYTAKGVTPGTYYAYVVQGDKVVDRVEVKVKAEDTDLTLNDDMTRDEYIKSMTPEQKKALEEYKKKNAAVTSANAVIAKLNGTLKTVRADLAASTANKDDVSKDVAMMKEAVDAKPDTGLLWLTYGDTQLAQGRHLAEADKKAGKSPTADDAVTQLNNGAVESYQKAVALDAAGAKPNTTGLAADYNQLGNALIAQGKTDDAIAAFSNAAKTDPTKAGVYYKNAAAVLYNAGQMDGALDAANKAIAADPNAADAYFIKGQALVTKSAVDPKTNKLTAPEGCVAAYEKFMSLAPNDPKVPQVKQVLASLGETIDTNYSSGKKKH